MVADAVTQGLARLGIVHHTTLPYSPYQNAKQEVFWAQLEGRLVAMLEGVRDLTLPFLNEATQAWVEMEHNRTVHSARVDLTQVFLVAERPGAVPSPIYPLERAKNAAGLRRRLVPSTSLEQ